MPERHQRPGPDPGQCLDDRRSTHGRVHHRSAGHRVGDRLLPAGAPQRVPVQRAVLGDVRLVVAAECRPLPPEFRGVLGIAGPDRDGRPRPLPCRSHGSDGASVGRRLRLCSRFLDDLGASGTPPHSDNNQPERHDMTVLHHRADGAGTAPPLILGPGLGTTLSVWEPQAAALARGRQVIRYDLPGHGGSPAGLLPAVATVGDVAGLVLALVDRLGIDRFAYAGISFGGAVGTWLAVNHPERVTSLVLICTSARFGEPDGWHERARLVPNRGHRSRCRHRSRPVVHPALRGRSRGPDDGRRPTGHRRHGLRRELRRAGLVRPPCRTVSHHRAHPGGRRPRGPCDTGRPCPTPGRPDPWSEPHRGGARGAPRRGRTSRHAEGHSAGSRRTTGNVRVVWVSYSRTSGQ